jgi:hypothetical protein
MAGARRFGLGLCWFFYRVCGSDRTTIGIRVATVEDSLQNDETFIRFSKGRS